VFEGEVNCELISTSPTKPGIATCTNTSKKKKKKNERRRENKKSQKKKEKVKKTKKKSEKPISIWVLTAPKTKSGKKEKRSI